MPAKIRPRAVPATLVASAVIVVLVWAAVLASSGAEAASDVGCGDTITTDTTLHHNLVNCPNNGHRHRRRQRHPRSELPHDRWRRDPGRRL